MAKKERVIFRKEFDRKINKERYYAIFPDEPANLGKVCYITFYYCEDMVFFEPFGEMSLEYYWKTKVIHKSDPIIKKLYQAVRNYYQDDFQVMEKLMYRSWRY